jgi:hypothetical protein
MVVTTRKDATTRIAHMIPSVALRLVSQEFVNHGLCAAILSHGLRAAILARKHINWMIWIVALSVSLDCSFSLVGAGSPLVGVTSSYLLLVELVKRRLMRRLRI